MANLYDLRKFDLNLLVIFECIYQNLSISKAAETLFITPSAVSQSLQRLRTQLNDPLFIRSGKGLTPTTVAVNLHHYLEDNLNQLEKTIQLMNRTDMVKKFVIYAPQLAVVAPVRQLLNTLREDQHLMIEHYDMLMSHESAEDLLNYRKADLIMTTSPSTHPAVVCQELQIFDLLFVCSASHPRLQSTATVEELLSEEYVMYMSEEPAIKGIYKFEYSFFKERQVTYRSDSFFALMNLISSSELVGIMPRDIYEHFKDFMQLKEVQSPLKMPKIRMYMIYNKASLSNSSFAKFIDRMN
ncbi:LysR family transcriptional regulator [Enterobacteriaceae bacterium 89]|nr:LysR family transcriptional regulator [Enterobacteriaceae bacterium 89]